jgi:transcriptional regulator with XRE-family HTH domain
MQITNQLTDDAVMAELGRRLAHTRLNRNMRQDVLAAEAGVSVPTVQRIERGQPTEIRSLIRVMRVLGLLDSLEQAVPQPLPSPIEQLKLQGRNRRRARARAAEPGGDGPAPWRWGRHDPPEQ